MNIRIQLDTPDPDSLRFLLEEMVDDPFVGRVNAPTKQAWVDGYMKSIAQRKLDDQQSVVAYNGSGIIGIAFSRPLGNQSYHANMKEENDYWKMGNFYVLKKFRGQGIGKRALHFFLEAKDRKVFYFADRKNLASNAVAKANDMLWLHDFFRPLYSSEKYQLCSKDKVVKTPAEYFHVYCGRKPPRELLLKPNL